MKDFAKLEEIIKVKFKKQDFLAQALVHRSYLNENPGFELAHNERLEFLGDAVLELIVTEYLYLNYPNPEGELTNWRASLVNAKILSEIAREIDLDDFLYLSKGEAKESLESKSRQYILDNGLYLDPKSRFQEITQEKFGITPNYKVLEEVGPDHDKKFKVGVYLEKELIATGEGSSKQEAQVDAALAGLREKGWQ